MKIQLINIVAILLTTFSIHAQETPTVVWQKSYGGDALDLAHCLIQTSDEGFAIAGYTESKGRGKGDMWLVKTDKDGEFLWDVTFGDQGNDAINSVIETTDNGFLLAGYTTSVRTNGKRDIWVIKTNKTGKPLWQNTFGGFDSDEAATVIENEDGSFVLAGYTTIQEGEKRKSYKSAPQKSQHILLVKLTPSGQLVWKKSFGNENYNLAHSVLQLPDGGFAVAGNTLLKNKSVDAWLIKTNADGELEWDKVFGGKRWDAMADMTYTKDGSLVLAGTTSSATKRGDMWIIKVDPAGNLLWENTFGSDENEAATALVHTKDGGFLVTVDLTSPKGRQDIWMMVKLDTKGQVDWYKVIGDIDLQRVKSIQETSDGSLVIVGVPHLSDPRKKRKRNTNIYMMKLGYENDSRTLNISENLELTDTDKEKTVSK